MISGFSLFRDIRRFLPAAVHQEASWSHSTRWSRVFQTSVRLPQTEPTGADIFVLYGADEQHRTQEESDRRKAVQPGFLSQSGRNGK